jgi:hypothetical protein
MAPKRGASLLQAEHAPIIGSRAPSHQAQDLRPRVSNTFIESSSPSPTALFRVTTAAAPSQGFFNYQRSRLPPTPVAPRPALPARAS